MSLLLFFYLSWLFAFSLLAKIALISGERTPVDILLSQKNSSPTKALMVSRRISKVSDCKHADSLFTLSPSNSTTNSISSPVSHPTLIPIESSSNNNTTNTNNSINSNNNNNNNNINNGNGVNNNNNNSPQYHHHNYSATSSPKSPTKSASRRGSLSSLLGNVSSGTYPETPQDILSRQHSLNEKITLDESNSDTNDPVIKYRQELNPPRTPPAKFGELQRLDSRTYGDLETLLLSKIESYAEYNYIEDGAISYDSSGQPSDTNPLDDDDEINYSDDNDPNALVNPSTFGLELSSKESKFRINYKGEILIEDNGQYRRASKNLSLYYDMITDKELEKLYEQDPAPLFSTSPKNSSQILSHSHTPFQSSKHELTAVDMLTPNRAHTFLSSIANEKKQKEELLEKNSDFIETLCRITELKCQTGESTKSRKPKLDHVQHHPLQSLFGTFGT